MAKTKRTKTAKRTLSIRASTAWISWAKGLADHERLSLSDAIDKALIDLARKGRYSVSPPRR